MAHFYRFKPPFVSQGDEVHCWAAALQSWLSCVVWTFGAQSGEWRGIGDLSGTQWRRRARSKAQLLADYEDQEEGDGSLTSGSMAPYRAIGLDCGMDVDFIDPASLTQGYLTGKLRNFGHLYVTYFSVHMRHAVVVYGTSDTDGIAVMDPNPNVKFTHRTLGFFKTPERLKEWVTVGWPVKP
jgi:hypothetical protein